MNLETRELFTATLGGEVRQITHELGIYIEDIAVSPDKTKLLLSHYPTFINSAWTLAKLSL
jgi:hypothetical protein